MLNKTRNGITRLNELCRRDEEINLGIGYVILLSEAVTIVCGIVIGYAIWGF